MQPGSLIIGRDWGKLTGTSRETPVQAETSYGCQKQIIELYTYDYGRKGFLETRSVRLPTVAIRPGAVSHPIPYPFPSAPPWLTAPPQAVTYPLSQLPPLSLFLSQPLTPQPSSAASSFISGLIREPLQGLLSVCPIASSPDDPILDSLAHYVTRTKTVVRNIAYALCMPEDGLKARGSRTINLPGIRITPRLILNAL